MRSGANKANDLFLLMLNLSQISLKEMIIDIFLEAVKEVWQNITIKFNVSYPEKEDTIIEISSANSCYGFISIHNFNELNYEDQDLLHNACGMLAVILKKNEHERLLADEKLHLEKLVEERTHHLNTEIQDRKRAESQLIHAQKIESIGTLAGGIAHEINNPINGIMNYAQLIKDKLGTGNPISEFSDGIIHETKRVAKIVRNLLVFAREEKESHSPARIIDIVNDTMSLIQVVLRKDQIILAVDVSEDLPKIKCRSQQIQQVLMNLVTNSRDTLNEKYSGYDENKKIEISSSLFRKDGRRWIRTTVKDWGMGIDPDNKDKLFDPFFTTKGRTAGTGLGLSISYGIVSEHHGELTFESMPGEYTQFHMDLPVDNGWDLDKNEPVRARD